MSASGSVGPGQRPDVGDSYIKSAHVAQFRRRPLGVPLQREPRLRTGCASTFARTYFGRRGSAPIIAPVAAAALCDASILARAEPDSVDVAACGCIRRIGAECRAYHAACD